MKFDWGKLLDGADEAFGAISPTAAQTVNRDIATVAGDVSAVAAQVGHITSKSTFTATVAQAFGVSEGEILLGAGVAVVVIILLVRTSR